MASPDITAAMEASVEAEPARGDNQWIAEP
jgi:hypothetical protein